MDNAEKVIKALCSDNSIEIPDIEKLERILEEEIARDNPDFDLIDEITATILELKNIDVPETDIDSEIRKIKHRGIKHRLKFRLPRFLSVAAVITVIVAVNLFASPFIADGVKNFFPSIDTRNNKTVLDFTNSGTEKEYVNVPTKESNYNIIRKLTSLYGFNVYIPTEGIPLNEDSMYMEYEKDNGVINYISFTIDYKQDNENKIRVQKTVSISYEIVDDNNLDKKVIELSEDSVLDSGFLIDGMDAYVFFDRTAAEWPNCQRCYTMYFYQSISETEGILTTVDTYSLSHDEAYKIFKSFK